MRKPVKEIENVLQNHGYSINTIIVQVMKTFKLKTLCRQVGFQKQAGYTTSETLRLMLMLPLMLLKSVHALYKSEFQKVTTMKQSCIYRLKNNEKMPWRASLLVMAKQFQRLVNPTNEVVDKSAFILDDTIHAQHFSLYTVKPLISLVLLPISKVYQIRSFSKLLVNPIFLLKSERMRGQNAKKLLCKISKIYEECLPH